ncbi:hypothetical protein ACFYY1_30405 [Streptomyces sp. NPDC001890]|uniref:hypothetical protein n=1 Tax=Streptomyces sp. NPDC001890 TaxID=3364620 RepID=UPI0036B31A8D
MKGTRVLSPRRDWHVDAENKIFTAGGAGTVHASTIALVDELFGRDQARDLAATWDSLPFYGEALFNPEGPVMNDEPEGKAALQDAWENTFLPE